MPTIKDCEEWLKEQKGETAYLRCLHKTASIRNPPQMIRIYVMAKAEDGHFRWHRENPLTDKLTLLK